MSEKDALKPSVVLILIFILPAVAAAFLPKAIYSAVNGSFRDSWIGFTMFGIFFAMGVAGLISILSSEPHNRDSEDIKKAEKLAE